MIKTLLVVGAIAGAIFIAEKSQAATASQMRDAVVPPRADRLGAGDAPRISLADPRLFLAPTDAQAYALKRAGIARTSLERRYDEDLSGALGFICGLQPGAERSGAAAARGYDPNGRFLGAKLSLAFK